MELPNSPNGEGSSPASSAAANPLVGNAGPAFDPKSAPPADTPSLRLAEHQWEAPRVRTILRAQGLMTHEWIGVGVEDWVWRDSELEAIAEPLANAANRIPMVRAAAAVSDELTVGAVMFEYAFRSIRERSAVLRALKEAEEAEQAYRSPAPVAGPRTFVTGADSADTVVAHPAEPVDWEVP